ncbi:short-chain fatty acid transporter [Flexivirga oryzae]|uniref:Short-chain fatty acids transporter n=1 Tax=Flexivirga oryzae TaxID=1794944 RepID=A0A839NEK4_9MICO|nr:TIGR00366 family protein [Flexivirga oryzae]MBB2893585.1 short-chain fatty acids transporter [Flexivirga oryzae]
MERLQNFFTDIMRKYMPDPLVLVIGLTFLTAVLAMVFEGTGPHQIVTAWGDGFWNLLEFAMQMALVLVLGYVLAKTSAVDRLLELIASKVDSPRAAIVIATLVGGIASYLNWGFGLVIGGVIAKKLASRVSGVHYPLIIASAYSAFTLYGLGLSASIPVVVSTPGHPLEKEMGVLPLAKTIFSWQMLTLAVVVLIVLMVLMPMMHPRDPRKIVPIAEEQRDDRPTGVPRPQGRLEVAERLNHSRLAGYAIGALGVAYLVMYFVDGGNLNINTVNFTLLFVGILLCGTPATYVDKLRDGITTVSGVVLQYPFYAGIMAIMAVSGLVGSIASGLTSVASADTLPVVNLLASWVINFFAPSAGGHWVLQGPFAIEAAHQLGSPVPVNTMAVMLGNAWNDIIQPLWLIPALALSRLRLKDIMGYLVIAMIVVGVLYAAGLFLWSMGS